MRANEALVKIPSVRIVWKKKTSQASPAPVVPAALETNSTEPQPKELIKMNFVAPNAILNTTLADAQQFVKSCTAMGKPGGAIFCNPVQGTPGENAGGMLPLAEFAKAGVPAGGPLYLAVQFGGEGDYYNIGLCIVFFAGGVPFSQLFQ